MASDPDAELQSCGVRPPDKVSWIAIYTYVDIAPEILTRRPRERRNRRQAATVEFK